MSYYTKGLVHNPGLNQIVYRVLPTGLSLVLSSCKKRGKGLWCPFLLVYFKVKRRFLGFVHEATIDHRR